MVHGEINFLAENVEYVRVQSPMLAASHENVTLAVPQIDPSFDRQGIGQLEVVTVGDVNAMPLRHHVKRAADLSPGKTNTEQMTVVGAGAVLAIIFRAPPSD